MGGLRKSAFQVKTTVIDFLEFGGAIGKYGTGLYFEAPSNCILLSIAPFRPFTSAGLATVSFGWRSIDLAIPQSNDFEFVNNAAIAGLTPPVVGNVPCAFLSKTQGSFAWELTYSIAAFALTDFNAVCTMVYIQLDQ